MPHRHLRVAHYEALPPWKFQNKACQIEFSKSFILNVLWVIGHIHPGDSSAAEPAVARGARVRAPGVHTGRRAHDPGGRRGPYTPLFLNTPLWTGSPGTPAGRITCL